MLKCGVIEQIIYRCGCKEHADGRKEFCANQNHNGGVLCDCDTLGGEKHYCSLHALKVIGVIVFSVVVVSVLLLITLRSMMPY